MEGVAPPRHRLITSEHQSFRTLHLSFCRFRANIPETTIRRITAHLQDFRRHLDAPLVLYPFARTLAGSCGIPRDGREFPGAVRLLSVRLLRYADRQRLLSRRERIRLAD